MSEPVTKPISEKQSTLKKQAIETDYSVQRKHSVGQLVHNIHKTKRVL